MLSATLATLAACGGGGNDHPQMPPAEVGAIAVQSRPLALALEYPAQLRGVREVEVRARVEGILLERRYEPGARVKEGELLFRIDPAPFRAEAARARAELAVQQAQLREAARDRERIEPLAEQKLVSRQDLDAAVAAHERAEAAVAAAQADLRKAELDLSYTEVRAPIQGLTSREVRSEGSLVSTDPESSLLTQIVQGERLYAELSVPENDAATLRDAVSRNPRGVHVQLVEVNGTPVGPPGPIEFVAPRVANDTGTVAVRAIIDNAQAALLPGQVVRASIRGVEVAGAIVVPRRAIMRGPQGTFVYVVDAKGTAQPRPVELGIASGNLVAVTSGLKAGERAVVDGVLKVMPGAPVKAMPVELEPAREPLQVAARDDEKKAPPQQQQR
jgi:membrane fusion protein (multidrug efflux system)